MKKYLIYILNVDGDYYYVNSAGDVDTTGTPTPLNYNPKDWREMSIQWLRGMDYKGVFRSLTTPLQFVNDGAQIIRHIYLNEGSEGVAKMEIHEFNDSIAVNDYELIYECEVDLSTVKNQLRSITANSTDNGNEAKIKAHETNEFEIPVDQSPDYIWVKMHGINLQFRQSWFGIDNEVQEVNNGRVNSWFQYSSEGTNLYFDLFDQYKTDTDWKILRNQTDSAITFDINIKFNYNLYMDPSAAYDGYFELQLWEFDEGTGLGTGINQVYYSTTPLAGGNSATYSGQNNLSITLSAGHVLKVRTQVKYYVGPTEFTYPASDHEVTQLTGNRINLSISNKMQEGYIKAIRPIELLTELSKKVTEDSTLSVESDLLEDVHFNKVLTSGDGLRDLENSVIKISFKDTYTSFDSLFGTTLQYNKSLNKLKLELVQESFQDVQGIHLGEASEVTYEPITSELPSSIKNGYEPFATDEVNGKDGFNVETFWTTPLTKKATPKQMVSKFIADMYPIEFQRLNLMGKVVTDAENDNSTYILHIEDTVGGTIPDGLRGEGEDYYNLVTIPDPAYLQNIYSPETAFNYELTPKRCLLNNGPWLHSVLFGQNSKFIKFTSNDKTNAAGLKLVYDDGSIFISEKDDIQVSDLADAFFYPIMFRAKIKQPINIRETIETNRYKYVTLDYRGETFKFWIYEAKAALNMEKTQEFMLIPHIDNDLSKLIY